MGGAVWQSIVFEKHWLQDWKGFLIKQQQMLKAFDTLIFILLIGCNIFPCNYPGYRWCKISYYISLLKSGCSFLSKEVSIKCYGSSILQHKIYFTKQFNQFMQV